MESKSSGSTLLNINSRKARRGASVGDQALHGGANTASRGPWAGFALACKFALGAGLLLFVARSTNWSQFWQLLSRTRPGPFAAAFLLFLAACALTVVRWRVLLGAFPRTPSLSLLMRISFIGIFLNTFLPGGVAGDVVRGLRIQDKARGQAPGFASIFTDRFLGLCGLSLLAIGGAGMISRDLVEAGLHGIFLTIIGVLLTAGAFFYSRRIGKLLVSPLARFGKIGARAGRFLEAIRIYRTHGWRVGLALGVTFASHALFVVGIVILARSLQIDLPWKHFLAFVPVIALLSAVPLSVNGLGIREAGYVLLFTRVGVVQEQALTLSFLHFGLLLLLGLVGGAILVAEELLGRRKVAR